MSANERDFRSMFDVDLLWINIYLLPMICTRVDQSFVAVIINNSAPICVCAARSTFAAFIWIYGIVACCFNYAEIFQPIGPSNNGKNYRSWWQLFRWRGSARRSTLNCSNAVWGKLAAIADQLDRHQPPHTSALTFMARLHFASRTQNAIYRSIVIIIFISGALSNTC